jgi:quercetin dioxygenase-like cupin family protein
MLGHEETMSAGAPRIHAAEIELPSGTLDETLDFFTARLGFRLETIFPADAPAVAVIAGHGLRLRLARDAPGAPGAIRLACRGPLPDPPALVAPNGTRVEFVAADPPLVLPPLAPRFVLTRAADTPWVTGRAGMAYRDLIPDRLGGRFIASHIRIADGGPVPDYVHYHRLRFQMIYCVSGWVRVVYEDQGQAFTMQPGDCVLQPPEIRHRVLESSAGLEVIELSSPALHETHVDHALALPMSGGDAGSVWSGQRFVRHVAATATRLPWRCAGWDCRDTGIAAATAGLAGVRVARPHGAVETPRASHGGELSFSVVLSGQAMLECEGTHALGAGDAFTVPAGLPHGLFDCTHDLQLLEVSLPANPTIVGA